MSLPTSGAFLPHGMCFLWNTRLLALNIISDALIAIAYYSIPIILLLFIRKRADLPFPGVFVMFCVFIIACGTTHVMDVWTIWHPVYWLAGIIKGVTAGVSVATAVVLVKIIPNALALTSPTQLQKLVDDGIAELKQTNTKLETLINASPFAIVCLDAAQRVILWSSAAEEMFGYGAQEILGRAYPLIIQDDNREFDKRFKLLADGNVLRNVASRRRHKDGTVIDTSSSASAYYDATGSLLGIIFVIEDTREQNQLQNQLRQAQKMEAVGRLTGGIAHDFNNLLAIILGNLELLGDRVDRDPLSAELVADALRATKRGASLTHRLLAYSRQQRLTPSVVDVGTLVTNLIGMLRRVVEESITIKTDIAPDLWTPRIDPQQLEDALVNLTINARDAMLDGGTLTIAAHNVFLDEPDIAYYAEVPAGSYVVLSVSDSGTGMAKSVLDRALEPFFTTKPLGSGTGLGLSIVYGFVKQSGGHLTIYSEPGMGTTVKLYLGELHSGPAPAPLEESKPVASEVGNRLILVVEDDASVRKLQIRMLHSLGYQTLEADHGSLGLAVLNDAPNVDLVLTDIVLPGGMSGPAFAEAARALRPELKVIFMSGYAPAAVSQRYNLSGADLLPKPFTRDALARVVRHSIKG